MIYEVTPDKCRSLPDGSRMYIACLFTSKGTGQQASRSNEIIANTGKALKDFKEQLRIMEEQRLASQNIGEIWAPRMNSGCFRVPWRLTRAVIERSGVDMHIKFPARQTEVEPRRGPSEDTEAAETSLVTDSSLLRAGAKRSHESSSFEGETTVKDVDDVTRPKRPKIGNHPGKRSSSRSVARHSRTLSGHRNDENTLSGKSESPFEGEMKSDDKVRESEHDTVSYVILGSRSNRSRDRKKSNQPTATGGVARPVGIPRIDEQSELKISGSLLENETTSKDEARDSEHDTDSIDLNRPVERRSSRRQSGEKPKSRRSESLCESETTSDDESQESEPSVQGHTHGVARTVKKKSSRHRSGRIESPLGEKEV